ncbi:MAG: hypothetical protein GXP25_25040 [Planctomycetes bacterium]|nr:hypothetical protein [Planctomycetota bacterium]
MSVKITEPIDGAILNRLHGKETAEGLDITVKGTCPSDASVAVNGQSATVNGEEFSASIRLQEQETTLIAEADGESDSILVLYDKNSFKRYRFSLDDDIYFLRDLARSNYKSIFDNPFLALWKRLHDTYGTRTNCNLYFQCDDFNLTMMPDQYKSEWADNADWFRLTFHALQNDPNEPYIHSSYDEVARDYDKVVNEILRFAGEEVMNTFTTIHWGEATVDGCRAVRDRGINGLCGYFVLHDGRPKVSYYLDREHTEHLSQRDYWKDTKEDIIFVRHAIVCNNGAFPPEKIPAHLGEVAANPYQGEVLELMIHEQYFYPDYQAYLPDYAERCETAVRWCAEHDYEPVFYSDGFIGNPG